MTKLQSLEGEIYRNISEILSDKSNQESILTGFPDKSIPRRNTGYCLDLLVDSVPFKESSDRPFNFSKLLAGSEGTLAIATELKLSLVPLPPPVRGLLCVHLRERRDAFRANLTALKFSPAAVEMMDDRILRLTENNLSQRHNRFFISGEPGAILIVEFTGYSNSEIEEKASALTNSLKNEGFGYHFPFITGSDISRVWELRRAGLGVLSNMKGDAKPVSLIEDTAVKVEDLPFFMDELTSMLDGYGKDAVLHAHIGTGELHVRPLLNLKDPDDVALFREIAIKTAHIVRKYRGSLSGEHGDGRLRGEFIPLIIGEQNFNLIVRVKEAWDPENILNPGKIVRSLPMNSFLRYQPGTITAMPETVMDFSDAGGIVRAAEQCNGSADCRKPVSVGGTMCPSYMATGDERLSTRARANILRQYLPLAAEGNWNLPEIHQILDLCLSCKGCKAECPSAVDIAKIKAEFLQHWNDVHGISLRTWFIAHITSINKLGSLFPYLFNASVRSEVIGGTVKRLTGIAKGRSIPTLYRITLTKWLRKNLAKINPTDPISEVCLFIDEFTRYNDVETGIKAVKLLTSLNYRVLVMGHDISGRTFISKGLLRKSASIAARNIEMLYPCVERGISVIGIEPSAILSFRDEYPDLVKGGTKEKSLKLAASVFTIDEFLADEFRAGRITSVSFTSDNEEVLVHVHCQQKAICGSSPTIEALSIPSGYNVREIPSGCCGMAGSFGYEKEHYDLANNIGELVLFPGIRDAKEGVIISAPGTSCRHHIKDGTGARSIHPVEVLYDALLK